jgi:putative ABC transport system permease protein
MSSADAQRARPLMRPRALVYLYQRRLRVHAVQELLAGLGVAFAVALIFATTVVSGSVTKSAAEVVHTVVGPATLQLRTSRSTGMDQRLLTRVEHLSGVKQAAPLLEQTATLEGAHGTLTTVDLAGADTSLVVLDGLAHTLPIATLAPGGIGLSEISAQAIGVPARLAGTPRVSTGGGESISLRLRGQALHMKVSDVLGPEAFGALSQANVAVMPLADLQRLAGLNGRITRILVEAKPGMEAVVRGELRELAGGHLEVVSTNQDVELLHQALRPSNQASTFFASISVLLGVLLAFNALLLTVPERRRAIADLRLIGVKRTAIVQMLLFQTLCLSAAASAVGLLGGYALSRGVFHQSTGYLAEAFTLGTNTIVTAQPLILALIAGLLATFLASAVPLLDLRRGGALDAVYQESAAPGSVLSHKARWGLAIAGTGLLAATTVLFVTTPLLALTACALLALATVLVCPLAFAGVLNAGQALTHRFQQLTILPVALSSLRATTVRSLALAATGSVALFGSVALGGSRGDLLHGIKRFAHSYSDDADIWVGNPGDNQATVDFRTDGVPRRIRRIGGVASVQEFQGGFLQLGDRRVWIIARPPGGDRKVLESQISGGSLAKALMGLAEGGGIVLSKQIAEEHNVGIGEMLTLPTPSGPASFRIASTTTNLAWSPGVIFMSTADYSRLWATHTPTALGIHLASGADPARIRRRVELALGPGSGLGVTTAPEREASINKLTGEGLSQLGEISLLLLITAILAMSAALTSAIWGRRVSLAALRLSGVMSHRVRLILLVESALMLGAGCITGALAGVYGQVVIDGYLNRVTGFPVESLGAGLRPFEIFVLVMAVVLAIATVPAWLASRVSPTLALDG